MAGTAKIGSSPPRVVNSIHVEPFSVLLRGVVYPWDETNHPKDVEKNSIRLSNISMATAPVLWLVVGGMRLTDNNLQ